MSAPLLTTKLYFPPVRPSLVSRPRLIERLNQGLQVPLTLISAPAGYGKSTLMSEWRSGAREEYPAAWYSIDSGDNDPVRFWSYFFAALDMLQPGLIKNSTLLLRSDMHLYEPLVTSLINELSVIQENLAVILDDYYLITNPEIHAGITFLIDHMLPQLHLVIVTRSDPPLPLARLRARGQLAEIRAEHLRFTSEEVATFLNWTARLSLSAGDISALEERTEGWIAGLQMAALTLQDVSDRHAFVAAFHGDDRYIADYLVEEVLQRQPVEFQLFLLQTSILDRLTGSLCDAVTGRSDSKAVLNILERANLFLAPLDNHREWFRYHPLFASLLRQRLVELEGNDAVSDLKRRVWQWYAGHGFRMEAVNFALECGDFDPAAHMIEELFLELFTGNGLNTLYHWAAMLPENVIAAHPKLNVMAAWAAHATGHPQQCELYLEMIENTAGMSIDHCLESTPFPEEIPGLLKAAMIEGAVIRSRLAIDHFDLKRTFTLGERVLPYLTRDRDHEIIALNLPSALRCGQLYILGLAHELRGDLPSASRIYQEAEEESVATAVLHITALSLGHQGDVQVMQGSLSQAEEAYQRAVKIYRTSPPYSSPFFGMASVGLGNLAYERNDLAKAEEYLTAGLELGKLWNHWECLLSGYLGLAKIAFAQGEPLSAQTTLDELLYRAGTIAEIIPGLVEAWKALFALRQGDMIAANRWAATFNPDDPDELFVRWEQNSIVAAHLLLAQGKWNEAMDLLNRLLDAAVKKSRRGRVLEITSLQALVLAAQGYGKDGLETLGRALAAAEPQGYVRLFLDEGAPMVELLKQALAQRISEKYVARLLAQLNQPSVELPPSLELLSEPLSERERQVLKLVAEGKSNAEIATQLVLATGTVKRHLYNIFEKLDVQNRTQCVARARKLGLVD